MLTNDAVQAALPLAQSLVAKKLTLIAADSTPLGQLVKNTTGLYVSTDAGGQFAMSFDENTAYAKEPDAPGAELIAKTHDMIVDEVVPEVAKAIVNHISYAKNVVAPAVETFVSKVDETLKVIPRDETLSYTVEVWNPPQPLVHPVFENLLSKFETIEVNPAYRLPFVMPAIDPDVLVERVKTGNSDLDISISVWLSSRGEKFLENVYYNVFGSEYADRIQSFIGQRAAYSGTVTTKLDELVAIFLLSNGFIDNPPDGISMSLGNFNLEMRVLNNLAGALLLNELKIIESNASAQPILIRYIDQQARQVVVNKEAYDQFLEQGGDADAVLGSILSKDRPFTLEHFLQQKALLSSLWNKHVALATASSNKYLFAKTKSAMRSVFGIMMADDKEDLDIPRDLIYKRFDEALDRVTEHDLADPYFVALRLLCHARYFRTDSEKLLSRIDALVKENPKLDVREASTIAEIEYVSDWWFSQMRLA